MSARLVPEELEGLHEVEVEVEQDRETAEVGYDNGRPPDLTREQRALIDGHLGLARALARRFAHRGEALDDLEQVAMLALVKVSRRYDGSLGASFSTYATTSILGELKRYFRDHSWVMRVPRKTQETYLAFKRASEALEQDYGRPASMQELSRYLGVSEEEILEAMEAGRSFWPASLDAPSSDDSPAPIDELASEDENFDLALDRQRLQQLLPALTEREQVIITLLFFENWTQQRVADRIGVSQMQVSRLLHRILAHLRRQLVEA